MLKEIKKKYKLHIGNFSCHSLRKTFGRQVYNMNSDNSALALVKLLELFNNSSVSSTKRDLGLRQEELLNTYAVSYTHLDVYKRQAMSSSLFKEEYRTYAQAEQLMKATVQAFGVKAAKQTRYIT